MPVSLDKYLQDTLNTYGGNNIQFRITNNTQTYDTWMKIDEKKYFSGILNVVADSFKFTNIETLTSTYELQIYGFKDDKKEFENVFKKLKKDDSNKVAIIEDVETTLYFLEPIYEDWLFSADTKNNKMFVATISITASYTVGSITGKSTTLKVDGFPIDFSTLRYRKDKSLISNVTYGNSNESERVVNDQFQIEFPINATTLGLFGYGLDKKYNKKFALEWNIGGYTKVIDLVYRTMTIEYNNNNQPITFWAIFEFAYQREEFKINGYTIPVIKWDFNSEKQATGLSTENGVKSEPYADVRTITATLVKEQVGIAKVTNETTVTVYNAATNKYPQAPGVKIEDVDLTSLSVGGVIRIETIDAEWVNLGETTQFLPTCFVCPPNYDTVVGQECRCGGDKYRYEGVTNYTYYIIVETSLTKEIIRYINQYNPNKTFTVSYVVDGDAYSYEMYIRNGSLQSVENPPLLINVTFVEAQK